MRRRLERRLRRQLARALKGDEMEDLAHITRVLDGVARQLGRGVRRRMGEGEVDVDRHRRKAGAANGQRRGRCPGQLVRGARRLCRVAVAADGARLGAGGMRAPGDEDRGGHGERERDGATHASMVAPG